MNKYSPHSKGLKFATADSLSSETRRPTTCSQSPEILLDTQVYCSQSIRNESREQVAGRRNLISQLTIRFKPLNIRMILLVFSLIMQVPCQAETGEAYLDKFLTYERWSQNLPTTANPEFIEFIENQSPLTNKLREKWLYLLAQKKDWVHFNQYYRDSTDTNLQCYQQMALYQLGKHEQAKQSIPGLWLRGSSAPKACNELFELLLKNHEIGDSLIEERIALALDVRNIALVRYLLKVFNPPRLQDIDLIVSIYQKPLKILQLQPGRLHGDFYLFGLKQLIPRNMGLAIKIWNKPRSQLMMNEKQQQTFIAQVALYKAMRNEPDAYVWLEKINPSFCPPALFDWKIRYAISHQNWPKLIYLVEHSPDKDNLAWQYWLARAYESLGAKTKATELYQHIGTKRNYYGFLANNRIAKPYHLENETIDPQPASLAIYQPITDQIKNYYVTHQSWLASRWLNDFSSELSKKEQIALASWVANELHWYGKSVYLSNNKNLNNQLVLRFPLAYQTVIRDLARRNQVTAPLIYAMIRQESTFFEDIISSAGANGLMQLLPVTAKHVAKRERIPYSQPSELFIIEKNLSIGVAYLRQLGKQFGWHPVLMVAAYNAGPKQVNYWLKNHAPEEIDIWIETLPWQETRNYLKNVIAFYAVYQYRLHEKPNVDLFLQPFKLRKNS